MASNRRLHGNVRGNNQRKRVRPPETDTVRFIDNKEGGVLPILKRQPLVPSPTGEMVKGFNGISKIKMVEPCIRLPEVIRRTTRIKLAYITPTAYIGKFGSQGDFQLGLSHLLNKECDNDYAQALKATKQRIVLDNGTFENGIPEGSGSLLQKAVKMGASVVFAPDHLYLPNETRFALDVMIGEAKQQQVEKKVKIGAVVQADNEEEWFAQYEEFQFIPEVALIGLSILSIPKAFAKRTGTDDITTNRLYLLNQLLRRKNNGKQCHLLGAGGSGKDIEFAAKYCPFVYSNDSSCCFQSGLFEKRLTETFEVPGGKVKEKVDFDLKNITEKQAENIQYNIDVFKRKIRKLHLAQY